MIILRVAMGHGWRKNTAKEIDTTLVFATRTTVRVHEQSQGVHVTTYSTKDPNSGLGTPAERSIGKHMSATGADPVV